MVRKLGTNGKALNKIGTKLFCVMLFSIAASVAVSVIALNIGNKEMVNIVLEDSTRGAMSAILHRVEEMSEASLELAKKMAVNEDLIAAVESGVTDEIKQAAQNIVYLERGTVEFVSVTDKNGTVLARTHDDAVGDSIAAQHSIAGALSGKTDTYIEAGTTIRLSVISSSPLKNAQGDIIGGVAMGFQLDRTEFADDLKHATGVDITVFADDERINTTIIKDGNRQIGTKLAPAVAEIVLGQAQSYYSTTNILGYEYYAAYEPIITDGRPVGIFFAGKPIDEIRKRESELTLLAVGISIAVAIAALFINRIITRRMIVRPVEIITEAARKLSAGDLNIGKIAHNSGDEIGRLSESMGSVADVLSTLISELKTLTEKHTIGETDTRIDETAFQGAYAQVAADFNTLLAKYIRFMKDLCIVLYEFGQGNFDVEYKQLPGNHGRANQSVELVRGILKDMGNEIESLIKHSAEGRLSERADAGKFNGDWKKLLTGLNAIIDAVIAPINEASDVLQAMSEGNLRVNMTGNYKGDFDVIKKSLNSTQKAILSYISEISETLGALSRQNLNVGIDRNYVGDFSVIRDDINMIIKTLNDVFIEFGSSAEQVANDSRHISDSSAKLSQGATEQASAVEELNAVIDQIAEHTAENVKTAEKVNLLVSEVSGSVENESQMMGYMLKAMEGINESSANISRIIKVIEDIAFQTNLLALNASVEAARAGEQGKGFAVVAEEVRNLAARSQSAAHETTALIEGSVQKVAEGVKAANDASAGLDIIVSKISEISGYIEAIAEASSEQNESIHQISSGIGEVSNVTNENTAISEESAAAAQELSSQAEVFRNTIARFKLKR